MSVFTEFESEFEKVARQQEAHESTLKAFWDAFQELADVVYGPGEPWTSVNTLVKEAVRRIRPKTVACVPVREVFVLNVCDAAEPVYLEIARMLAEETGAPVMLLSGNASLQSLDESEMRVHGWMRFRPLNNAGSCEPHTSRT